MSSCILQRSATNGKFSSGCRMKYRILLVAAGLALCLPNAAFPQAFVEHLSPPVLQRGAVTRLTIYGTETAGANGLWSSLPAELFHPRPIESNSASHAAFDVELPANAPLGL